MKNYYQFYSTPVNLNGTALRFIFCNVFITSTKLRRPIVGKFLFKWSHGFTDAIEDPKYTKEEAMIL